MLTLEDLIAVVSLVLTAFGLGYAIGSNIKAQNNRRLGGYFCGYTPYNRDLHATLPVAKLRRISQSTITCWKSFAQSIIARLSYLLILSGRCVLSKNLCSNASSVLF